MGILFGIIVGSDQCGLRHEARSGRRTARGGDIALSVRLQVQAGDLHFVVGFADATRAGHRLFLCVGGYLFRCRICRDGVQFHRYVVGDLGFIITFVPLVVVGCMPVGCTRSISCISWVCFRAYTDPPALAYANGSTGSDIPAVAYSTVYPLTMFLRVVAAQGLILASPWLTRTEKKPNPTQKAVCEARVGRHTAFGRFGWEEITAPC